MRASAWGVIRPSNCLGADGRRQTLVTLSTVGFGDVTLVSKLARTLVLKETIWGTFYITLVIARLVTMYSPSPTEPISSSTRP